MASVQFSDRLCERMLQKKSAVMVGLDPRWESLPGEVRAVAIEQHGKSLRAGAAGYERFCRGIIDATSGLCAIVKFQAAFFEQVGPEGMIVLQRLIDYSRQADLVVVVDGKRNDIGSTAEAYAAGYLGSVAVDGVVHQPWGADALTINPYLGREGLDPFFTEAEKTGGGVFVLVRTSNPSAGELQDQLIGDRTIYQTVAGWVEDRSSANLGTHGYGSIGAVVGATVPTQLAELRQRMPHAILLVPGFGAQGGSAADVACAFDRLGLGAVVNNSRGILFAYQQSKHAGRNWQDAARDEARSMRDALNRAAGL